MKSNLRTSGCWDIVSGDEFFPRNLIRSTHQETDLPLSKHYVKLSLKSTANVMMLAITSTVKSPARKGSRKSRIKSLAMKATQGSKKRPRTWSWTQWPRTYGTNGSSRLHFKTRKRGIRKANFLEKGKRQRGKPLMDGLREGCDCKAIFFSPKKSNEHGT